MRLLILLLGLALPQMAFGQQFITFQTPSGNIHCVIMSGMGADQDGARCDIGQFTPSMLMVPPPDCQLDWGNTFVIGAADASGTLGCVGDTAVNPGNQVLGYGLAISGGSVTCESEKTGLTCRNAAGHGFMLSKARQSLF
jgi:hypothetical protein